jgi:hypothetical protein
MLAASLGQPKEAAMDYNGHLLKIVRPMLAGTCRRGDGA